MVRVKIDRSAPAQLGAVDIYLNEDDCEVFFVLTRRGEEE